MMDVTPGSDSLALTPMLPATPPSHRSVWRELMAAWWSRSALVALVIVLGLVQGSRAALGDIALDSGAEAAAESQAETPGPAELEPAALRGRFYRPAGSDAVRPALRLRQGSWHPARAERFALACPDPGC